MTLYTNGDAVDIIENEGSIDYAVRHYCSGKHFKDPDTAKLWDAAGNAIEALVQHLEDETGRIVT